MECQEYLMYYYSPISMPDRAILIPSGKEYTDEKDLREYQDVLQLWNVLKDWAQGQHIVYNKLNNYYQPQWTKIPTLEETQAIEFFDQIADGSPHLLPWSFNGPQPKWYRDSYLFYDKNLSISSDLEEGEGYLRLLHARRYKRQHIKIVDHIVKIDTMENDSALAR